MFEQINFPVKEIYFLLDFFYDYYSPHRIYPHLEKCKFYVLIYLESSTWHIIKYILSSKYSNGILAYEA